MEMAEFKRRLDDRRDEISDRLTRIEDELETTRSNDDGDRAIEREGEEVLEAVGGAGLAELRAIEAALNRIESGSFGLCAKCGETISEERLNAVPHAALCMDCIIANCGD
jgi:RNA polymerase-binding transcription factor DksA